MQISEIRKLRKATARFWKRFSSRGLILMYHRVAEKDVDPWSLSVTPKNFGEHLEVLQRLAQPISLNQLVQAHKERNIPNRTVAITFDDGYANNLHTAKPILERYNIPATVFVISGFMGKNREFWWDELDQVLLQPGSLPEELCLSIKGDTHLLKLGAGVEYSEADHQADYEHYASDAQLGSRLWFYHRVWQQLQLIPDGQRREVLEEIRAWAEVGVVTRPTHRPMTSEQISIIEQGGLVKVGAHTVTHPLLSAHSLAFQWDEIQQSKADLEEVLGHPVTSFAYPFGAYIEDTVPLVREAGFTFACSTVKEAVWRHSDRFQLPRFEVKDWGGEVFEERLLSWFRR